MSALRLRVFLYVSLYVRSTLHFTMFESIRPEPGFSNDMISLISPDLGRHIDVNLPVLWKLLLPLATIFVNAQHLPVAINKMGNRYFGNSNVETTINTFR